MGNTTILRSGETSRGAKCLTLPPPGQLPLVSLLPAHHSIGTEPIHDYVALRSDLVKIVITRIDNVQKITRFALPVQWEPHEAAALVHEIRGEVWQLDQDGLPTHYPELIKICHQFCKRKASSFDE